MVTANNAYIRFDKKLIMNESNVEKYMRARRRRQPSPTCLFGSPSEGETDEFLEQHDTQRKKENQKLLEKYDLSNVPKQLLEGISEEEESAAGTSGGAGASEGVRFQPRIITDEDPPPTKNVFSPIQKMGSTSPTTSSSTLRNSDPDADTEYRTTPKRRRTSSESTTTSELETKIATPAREEPAKSDTQKKPSDPKA